MIFRGQVMKNSYYNFIREHNSINEFNLSPDDEPDNVSVLLDEFENLQRKQKKSAKIINYIQKKAINGNTN